MKRRLKWPIFSSKVESGVFPIWWVHAALGEAELFLASVRGRWGWLEVGDGRKFVPLDRLLAEVKVFESERDAAQKVVLTQRLRTEHA